MASPRTIANRRNARKSTGPRTLRGKARSRQNALRHGLSVKLPKLATTDHKVEYLAQLIAGPNPDPCRWHFAIIAAEAELELRRVRAIRLSSPALQAGFLSFGKDQKMNCLAATLPDLVRLDRYEYRALVRRNRALRLL